MGVVYVVTMLAAAQAGLPAPLPPIGTWTVEYNRTDCTLAHQFGDARAPVTFGFRPSVDRTAGELFILTGESGGGVRRGAGEVTIAPAGTSFPVRWASAPLSAGHGRGIRFDAPRAFWAALPEVKLLTVAAGTPAPIAIALGPMAKAMAAEKACGDDLLRQWGADPAALIVPPEGMMLRLFSPDNYPADAQRRGAQGRTTTVSIVNPAGRVARCTVIETSSDDALDKGTCDLLTAHAQFDAAPAGPPNRYVYLAVRWVLPGS